MQLKEVLLKRRSVRKFTDEPVSDEMIEELLIAAMSGPSACNRRPWYFHVVSKKEVLEELKKASKFSKFNAPLAIVVCGDLARALPFGLDSYWIQDCSAATENILLRVTDLGLGAVWCGAHPQKSVEENIKKILDLPKKQIPLNIIFIGHPLEFPEERVQYEKNRINFVK